ncbi:MAG: hypothetical protein KAR13_16815 [Desulfobulbaceae bacterium]|nr:hypothetical protein [Desulfobulbaceae bacterium]
MKVEDVPQDSGITEGVSEIRYALDGDGRYVMAGSRGWDVVNTVNRQAWDELLRQTAEAVARIRRGEVSVLAYYMALNQMDEMLLAQYARLSRWRIRRHLKPKIFAGLKRDMLARYARIFRVDVEELAKGRLPDLVVNNYEG